MKLMYKPIEAALLELETLRAMGYEMWARRKDEKQAAVLGLLLEPYERHCTE